MNKFFNTFSLIKKEFLIFSSIFLISLFLRLFDVSSRAMHHDESLHVFYSWKLFEGLGYSHNPMMHGPLQMELTSIFFSIMGDSDFSGGNFDSFNDHRIAMSIAISSLISDQETIINNSDVAAVSYKQFWDHLEILKLDN